MALKEILMGSRMILGFTGWGADDLHARLQKHNEGGCPHTAKFRPWEIESCHAFDSREKAAVFEAYLNPQYL